MRGKGKGGRATQPRRAPPRRPGRPKPTWVPPLRATSWWKPARAAGFIFTLASVYKGEVRSLVSADRRAATGCIYEQPRKGRLHSAEGRCSVSATSTCRLSCTTRLQYYGLQCGLLCTGRRCTAPCAPAVAVEWLEKARRHAPFARPATVRGRVCGRIGPLDLGLRQCEQVAEYGFGPFALSARVTREPHASRPERRRLSRQRSSRAGQLLSHAERAALVWRFAAKRWSIGRTTGRRSVAQPSRSHRGQLRRPGAALERSDHAATTITITPVSGSRRAGRAGGCTSNHAHGCGCVKDDLEWQS